MSLNDGITQKQRGRVELEALVAAFQQSGGTVTRNREHRATAECRICGARHLVPGQRAHHSCTTGAVGLTRSKSNGDELAGVFTMTCHPTVVDFQAVLLLNYNR